MRVMPLRPKHLVEFPRGCLNPGDQRVHLLIFAQFLGNRPEGARQVVCHAQDVAGKAGGRISPAIGDVLFHPAAHVLRLGLGVKHFLLGRIEVFAQSVECIAQLVALLLKQFFGNTRQFSLHRRICLRLVSSLMSVKNLSI
jgi:hypothetical protein